MARGAPLNSHIKNSGTRGFTLVELLVVMGILIAFTYMAVRLLSGGIDIWKAAEDARDQDERARVALDLLRQDLWLCDGGERSRFVTDYSEIITKGEAMNVARLRFVRSMSRADEARLRAGFAQGPGAVAGATAASPNTTVANAAPDGGTGLLEVAYSTIPDASAKDPALLLLRRAAVAAEPETSGNSIFTKDFFTRQKRGFMDPAIGGDVIGGVLYFGVQLASQKTLTFEKLRDQGGPEWSWDSTRGEFIGIKTTGYNKFGMSLARPIVPRERVFPRRVRAILILAREDADRRIVKLAKDAERTANEFILDDPDPLPVSAGDFVKIGGEICEVNEAGPRILRIKSRGAFATDAVLHREGLAVHRGRIFIMEVPNAAWRDADPFDEAGARR
ncbi:MAG: PilW family protein [Planctomycetota bacterium]